MPHKGQAWTAWEINMITEWLSKTFPDAEYRTMVRLGQIQPRLANGTWTPDEEAMLGVHRRYADAVVFLPDRLLLVEAVMRADPGKLAVLELYELLLPQTPELQQWKHLPIQKILLYSIEDPTLTELARRKEILAVHFVPSFFDTWFGGLVARHQRAPRTPAI